MYVFNIYYFMFHLKYVVYEVTINGFVLAHIVPNAYAEHRGRSGIA